MLSIIQTIIIKIIAGALFVATILVGGVAGLIGMLVRRQLPAIEELTASPVVEPARPRQPPLPRRLAVVTVAKPFKKSSSAHR